MRVNEPAPYFSLFYQKIKCLQLRTQGKINSYSCCIYVQSCNSPAMNAETSVGESDAERAAATEQSLIYTVW